MSCPLPSLFLVFLRLCRSPPLVFTRGASCILPDCFVLCYCAAFGFVLFSVFSACTYTDGDLILQLFCHSFVHPLQIVVH